MNKLIRSFAHIAPEREGFLEAPFEFKSLIEDLRSEAKNIRYSSEKGTHEAKGCWRPVFTFQVTERTFDRFLIVHTGTARNIY